MQTKSEDGDGCTAITPGIAAEQCHLAFGVNSEPLSDCGFSTDEQSNPLRGANNSNAKTSQGSTSTSLEPIQKLKNGVFQFLAESFAKLTFELFCPFYKERSGQQLSAVGDSLLNNRRTVINSFIY